MALEDANGTRFNLLVEPTNFADGIGYEKANVPDSIDAREDTDLSDEILSYMNQFLWEENAEDMGCMLSDSLKLQPKPTSILPLTEPTTSDVQTISNSAREDNRQGDDDSTSNAILRYMDKILMEEDEGNMGYVVQDSLKLQLQEAEKSLYEVIGMKYPPSEEVDQSATTFQTSSSVPEIDSGSESISLFIKAAEEANKLIPNLDKFIPTSRKNISDIEPEEENCRKKQANARDVDDVEHSEILDEILLNHAGDQNTALATLRETMKNEALKKTQQIRRKNNRRKVVDLRSLVLSCGQAIAADDVATAHVLLKQIRLYSSPFGDGNERLAHYVANALEARLAGTGSQIYRSLLNKRPSTITLLKAHHLYVSACPFNRVSSSYVGMTIGRLTVDATRIHIIDFGIHYGFPWPTFLQRFSSITDSPPRIRITGIEFPQPGFRPAERVEETGRRLAHYAKMFNISFEFNSIAKRWESIQIEDLKLDDSEVVFVNCIYRMKHLPDSSRNAVLSMIRKINPVLFIQGVVNGAYNAPFFLTRFREAFFHFSTLFEMLDAIVPRQSEDRVLLERDFMGRELFNVVACEGWDRVDRPETYKQWDRRTRAVGFAQCPLDLRKKERAKLRVRPYCNEFVVDQDGEWLLLGWKGKILYALSTWKPA